MSDRTCAQCGAAFIPARPHGKPQIYCSKACYSAAATTRRRELRQPKMAECHICGVLIPKRGRRSFCSDECRNEQNNRRNRDAYAANPGATYRKHRHLWRVQNARRMARIEVQMVPGITDAKIEARMEYFGWRCWVCGAVGVERDHVKPLARGGLHTPSNIRPICVPCNRSKKDAWPFSPPPKE